MNIKNSNTKWHRIWHYSRHAPESI